MFLTPTDAHNTQRASDVERVLGPDPDQEVLIKEEINAVCMKRDYSSESNRDLHLRTVLRNSKLKKIFVNQALALGYYLTQPPTPLQPPPPTLKLKKTVPGPVPNLLPQPLRSRAVMVRPRPMALT